jgi:hypothetical protein
VAKKKSSEAQLRQMIRKIVREELQRMQNLEDSEWMEDPDFPQPRGKMPERPEARENFDDSDPFDHGDLSPEHPSWVNFGRPQPDPSRKREQSPRVPEWPGPYTPDLETTLDNPPYISRRHR